MRDRLYYWWQPRWARFWSRYLAEALFVHINKTGGSSIEKALGMPFQHRTASEFVELVGPDRWERCFTFAVVRNPWGKVYSHYRFRVKTNQTALAEGSVPFPEWVRRAYGDREARFYDQPRMFMPQTHWIRDGDGRELVDFVGRFETLSESFDEVCDRLGVEAELPHLKRSPRTIEGYREAYDDEAREIVAHRFREDLDRFGYTF